MMDYDALDELVIMHKSEATFSSVHIASNNVC